jgi:hypothetical protein
VIFWFLKKQAMALWTGFILLRIGFRGGVQWIRRWTFGWCLKSGEFIDTYGNSYSTGTPFRGSIFSPFVLNTLSITEFGGTHWRSWLRHRATSRKVAGSFRPHFGPWVDSASNRIEYLEYFLHLLIILKSGSFILLEPSGPVQVCIGITLPLHFSYYEVACFVIFTLHQLRPSQRVVR